MTAKAELKTALENDREQIPDTQALILDAAITCVKRWGIEKVTLNDIAREAGVTRPTVYSYYKSRDEVVRFALLQSAYSYGEKLLAHVLKFNTPEERTIEAMIHGLKILPNEPSLALITETALTQMVNEHSLTTPAGMNIAHALLHILMEGKELSQEEIEEMAEFTMRFMLSMITMESPVKRSEEELRGFISRRLLPGLGLEVPAKYLAGSKSSEESK